MRGMRVQETSLAVSCCSSERRVACQGPRVDLVSQHLLAGGCGCFACQFVMACALCAPLGKKGLRHWQLAKTLLLAMCRTSRGVLTCWPVATAANCCSLRGVQNSDRLLDGTLSTGSIWILMMPLPSLPWQVFGLPESEQWHHSLLLVHYG